MQISVTVKKFVYKKLLNIILNLYVLCCVILHIKKKTAAGRSLRTSAVEEEEINFK